jgi:hypothetical protein
MLPKFKRAICILDSSFAPFQGPPKQMNLGCTAFLGLLFLAECFSRATIATDVALIPSAFHQLDITQQLILSIVLPIAGSDRLLPCFCTASWMPATVAGSKLLACFWTPAWQPATPLFGQSLAVCQSGQKIGLRRTQSFRPTSSLGGLQLCVLRNPIFFPPFFLLFLPPSFFPLLLSSSPPFLSLLSFAQTTPHFSVLSAGLEK